MTEKSIDQLSIDTIRTLAIDAVEKAKSGHPGMPMGAAPMGYQLFAKTHEAQSVEPDMDQPRPFRTVRRSRFDASVQLASPLRL